MTVQWRENLPPERERNMLDLTGSLMRGREDIMELIKDDVARARKKEMVRIVEEIDKAHRGLLNLFALE